MNGSRSRDADISSADIGMNLRSDMVNRCGRHVHVGPVEFRLLRHLLQHPGRSFSRREVIHAVWPNSVFVVPCAVEAHVVRLCKALKEAETLLDAGTAVDASSISTMRFNGLP
jgi:two-component system, OmpR family, phosphate regulon response regulator PhoB